MIHDGVLPRLQAWIGKHKGIPATPVIRRVLHTSGVPESLVDQRLEGLLPEGTAIQLGIYASPMEVMVSLTGPEKESGPVTIDRLFEEAKTRLGDIMYGEGDDTMESVVGRLLTDRHMTLALAESCTGGLIGHRLTQVPGSSSYVDRGIVSYSNRAKIDLLGVPSELIDRHGAVSAEVAAAMALRSAAASGGIECDRHRRTWGSDQNQAGRTCLPGPRRRAERRLHDENARSMAVTGASSIAAPADNAPRRRRWGCCAGGCWRKVADAARAFLTAFSVGLSVTGIAGRQDQDHLGLDGGPNDAMTKECRFHGGDRSVIKQRSAQAALDLLRRWLLKKGGG